jgi:hypothetical protein
VLWAAPLVPVVAFCLILSPAHFVQHMFPLISLESAPGARHLPWTGRERILEAARSLMKDPKASSPSASRASSSTSRSSPSAS